MKYSDQDGSNHSPNVICL